MANNPALYNAVIAGGSGGGQERWITSKTAADYAVFANTIEQLAIDVDAQIPVIVAGATAAEARLLQSITQGVMAGRFLNDAGMNFIGIGQAIAALFTQLSAELDPGEASGGISPFTNELYVDAGFVGTEDGSVSNPFSTIQAALDVVNADASNASWAIIVTPGDYSAEDLVLTGGGAFFTTIRAEGESTPINSIVINLGFNVLMENFNVLTTVNLTGVLRCVRCAGNTFIANGSRFEFYDCGTVSLVSFLGGAGANTIRAYNSAFVNITEFDSATVYNCIIDGGLTSTVGGSLIDARETNIGAGGVESDDTELWNCKVDGVVVGAQLRADNYSLTYIRDQGQANTVATIVNTDSLRETSVYAVPALAGDFADVANVVPGYGVGDNFVMSMDVPLADVGIVGAWVSNVAEITVRFFGTTAGGNVTVSFNKICNTVPT